MEIAVLALGCFWGPEIKFSKIDGIVKTEVGYCGGNTPNTTYKEVCTGETHEGQGLTLEFPTMSGLQDCCQSHPTVKLGK